MHYTGLYQSPVGANNVLAGYAGGIDKKIKLLELEGVFNKN